MGGRGNSGTRNTDTGLNNRTREQLDRLYESAAASKDLELMKSIRTELQRRDAELYKRSSSFDQDLFNKLPKKLQVKNITDIGKDKTVDGTRYRAVITYEDGFTRNIGDYTMADFKAYLEGVLKDRKYEQ